MERERERLTVDGSVELDGASVADEDVFPSKQAVFLGFAWDDRAFGRQGLGERSAVGWWATRSGFVAARHVRVIRTRSREGCERVEILLLWQADFPSSKVDSAGEDHRGGVEDLWGDDAVYWGGGGGRWW